MIRPLLNKKKRMLILVLACLAVGEIKAQDCGKASILIRRLNENHLQPRALNDSLSNHLFTEVFLQFDPAKIFFHQDDIAQLEKFRYSLDDEISNNKCLFRKELQAIFIKKVKSTKVRIDSILKSGPQFKETQYWSVSELKSAAFAKNDKQLKDKIIRDLKHDILGSAYQKHRLSDSTTLTQKKLEALLPSIISTQRQEFTTTFDNLLSEISEATLVETTYLRAIARVYDPHSEYFTLSKKKAFEESLSDERLSLGIDLDEDDFGRVQIVHIVPGGPAWKSGQVHKGDTPLQISWDDQSPIDLTEKDISEVDEIFYKAEGMQASLTVLKPSGEKITIQLEKEKIENTENSITGFVLSGQHKIGYIHLPGFFSDETERSPNGCANEVAKEILKLNRQKIEGLILDLRDNGGGSLREAVDLAGIFVDGGPMTIVEEKGQLPVSVKDMNRGMAFIGPLIVLVNGHSASASELVAAALQDYNRAVIVGSQTFGKATGQVVLPLANDSQEDFFKVTVNRLYRLTQKSLQQTGVVPDIILPEVAVPFRHSERDYRHALTNKSVEKKTYYSVLPLFYLGPWRDQNKVRMATNENFKSINKVNQMLSEALPLRLDAFVDYSSRLEQELDNKTKIFKPAPYIVALSENTSSVLDAHRKPPESHMKEIGTSPYIHEAFYIMCDIIESKKK
jgi:carboxyl-terminal processing protease